jgi:hypothetical protein
MAIWCEGVFNRYKGVSRRALNQPVEKCVTELTGGAMNVTGRGFLRVEILVKEEKEEANGKRGEAEVDKEGKRRCNGDKEEQAS